LASAAPEAAHIAAGRRAEDLVARDLEARGSQVLLRNFRRRTGELDLVALEGGVLVIVEVRMRSRRDFGGAAGSVDRFKQAKIIRTARQLLQSNKAFAMLPVRFDVAVVSPGEHEWRIEWIRHAFEASAT
jgi:putative endonuclease